MSDFIAPGIPPKWVPGPYREPSTPAAYKRPMTQPNWRYIIVPVASTLQEIAMRYYSNPMEALTRVFNDNREDQAMPDGMPGALQNPNQIVQPGTKLWLS
jgi:hypothetical protein